MDNSSLLAEFVGAAYAFTASVVLFLIQSWYQHLCNIHELLSAKLEELLASRRALFAELNNTVKTKDKDHVRMQAREKIKVIKAALIKVTLLTKLHFPELNYHTCILRGLTQKFLDHYTNIEKNGVESFSPDQCLIDAADNELNTFECHVFCSLDRLTKKPSRLLRNLLC